MKIDLILDWIDRHAWVIALLVLGIVVIGGAWLDRPF